MLAPQLDRFTAARQVAADGPSEIDHRAAPGRRAPAAGAITDGAGEALGNPLDRRLFRGDERAQNRSRKAHHSGLRSADLYRAIVVQ
jgi:hypothetical protein